MSWVTVAKLVRVCPVVPSADKMFFVSLFKVASSIEEDIPFLCRG